MSKSLVSLARSMSYDACGAIIPTTYNATLLLCRMLLTLLWQESRLCGLRWLPTHNAGDYMQESVVCWGTYFHQEQVD
jgi:hypothetical protein